MTEKTWIDTIFDATQSISEDADDLSCMANAMMRLGLRDGADELARIAGNLYSHEKAIRSAVGKECGDGARRAQDATANMLNALVGGLQHKDPA